MAFKVFKNLAILLLGFLVVKSYGSEGLESSKSFKENDSSKVLSRSRRSTDVTCSVEFAPVTCFVQEYQNITILSKDNIPNNVSILVLANNRFSSINFTDLFSFTKLEVLNVQGNVLVWIEDYSFSYNNKLKIIHLQNNLIESINNKTFFGLSGLLQLDMSRNKISFIERNTFANLPMLALLDLNYNQIENIPECCFCNLKTLNTLSIAYNRIKTIEGNAFQGLTNMHTLYIHNNNITQFNFTELSSHTGLTHITTHNNKWNCTCEQRKQFDDFLGKTGMNNTASCQGANPIACVLCTYPERLFNNSLHALSTDSVCPMIVATTSASTHATSPSNMQTTQKHISMTSTSMSSTELNSIAQFTKIDETSAAETNTGTNMPTAKSQYTTTTTTVPPPTQAPRGSNGMDYKLIIAVVVSCAFVLIVIAGAWIYKVKGGPSGKMSLSSHQNPAYDTGSLSLADGSVVNVFDS